MKCFVPILSMTCCQTKNNLKFLILEIKKLFKNEALYCLKSFLERVVASCVVGLHILNSRISKCFILIPRETKVCFTSQLNKVIISSILDRKSLHKSSFLEYYEEIFCQLYVPSIYLSKSIFFATKIQGFSRAIYLLVFLFGRSSGVDVHRVFFAANIMLCYLFGLWDG